MSPESDKHSLDVQASCREQVIQELESHFAKWRETIVRKIYNLSCDKHSDRTMYYPSREDELVQNAGKPEHPWYSSSSYPSPDFFRRMILPTLLSMTDDPDELLDFGLDAVDIFQKLLVADLSYTTHHTTRSLVESFFQNIDTTRERVWEIMGCGGTNATGQFKLFYGLGRKDQKADSKKSKEKLRQAYEARKCLTTAVALHQGWNCDKHYDGTDWTEGSRRVGNLFLPAYRAVPLEFRAQAMKVYVRLGGYEMGTQYLRMLPDFVKELNELGGKKLLGYFFELMEYVDKLRFESEDPSHGYNQFPIEDPVRMSDEFAELGNLSEFAKDGYILLKWLLKNSESLGLTFFGKQAERQDSIRMEKYSFPGIVEDFRISGYSDQQIHEVLDVLTRTPSLRQSERVFLKQYPEIDANFPGGFAELLPYLELMENAPRCANDLLSKCAANDLPSANLDKYLELGAEITAYIGDSARPYFGASRTWPEYFAMADSDWGRFRKMTIEARDNALRFNEGVRFAGDRVFGLTLSYYDDKNYLSWKDGLFLLDDCLNESVRAEMCIDKHRVPPDLWSTAIHHYHAHVFEASGLSETEATFGIKLPENARYNDSARIIGHLPSRRVHYGSVKQEYDKLREKDIDYRIACHLTPGWACVPQQGYGTWGIDYVEGVACPITNEILEQAVGAHNAAVLAVQSAMQGNFENHPFSYPEQPVTVAQLRDCEKKIDELSKDPYAASIFKAFDTKARIEEAVRMIYLKGIIFGPSRIETGTVDVDINSLIAGANPYTQMAIAGMSLLSAAGAIQLPGLPPINHVSHISKLSNGVSEVSYLEQLSSTAASLQTEISSRLPIVEKMILEARDTAPGLMPIGGKIHTRRPMDPQTLSFISKVFGFNNTVFKLIHAGSSLLVPPMPSALEFNMLVKILEMFGVVDSNMPDIQLAVAGRWNEDVAPYVGSAMLLGTDRGVLYEKGAFSTTHDSDTGARIMAYDAGVKRVGMPFDVEKATGRTDILGRHSFGDAYLYQILGTMASHQQFGGVFHGMMPEVEGGMEQILRQYGLSAHLRDSAWVFNHAEDNDSPENHERMVGRFTRVRMSADTSAVQYAVRQLVQNAHDRMAQQKDRIVAENPDEYYRLMKY